jgi:predicted transcriptional regulator
MGCRRAVTSNLAVARVVVVRVEKDTKTIEEIAASKHGTCTLLT